jgi:hypothetical protein
VDGIQFGRWNTRTDVVSARVSVDMSGIASKLNELLREHEVRTRRDTATRFAPSAPQPGHLHITGPGGPTR